VAIGQSGDLGRSVRPSVPVSGCAMAGFWNRRGGVLGIVGSVWEVV